MLVLGLRAEGGEGDIGDSDLDTSALPVGVLVCTPDESVEGIIEKYDNTSLWNAQGHSTINIANEVGGTAQQ